MSSLTLRDHLWLWGMKVNVLQEMRAYPFWEETSTLTTQQAIERTGIRNVLIAGHLPLTKETMTQLPAARRIIAKWGMHETVDGTHRVAYERAFNALLQAKELAAEDPRIESFLLDDFSTGTVDGGVTPQHLADLQFENAARPPQLPLMATFYEMSLDDERQLPLLPYFAGYMNPLWHAANIDRQKGYAAHLARLTGNKPLLLCIYVYDFGNQQKLSYGLMRRQLDVCEEMIRERSVYGVVILGTCMLDLDWESNRALYDWLDERGDVKIE